MNKLLMGGLIIIIFLSCQSQQKNEEKQAVDNQQEQKKVVGQVLKLNDQLYEILTNDSEIAILAEGFVWSEGPLWLPSEEKLIFSDVPTNKIYQWSEKAGLSVYLEPSGFTEDWDHKGELGSNGLILNANNELVLAQHGNRQIAKMTTSLNNPEPEFEPIASTYQGKRFNSPNDLIQDSKGNYYFTDPAYGLEKQFEDPLREIDFQGVYKVLTSGEVVLLIDSLTRPNGLALSPDESKLYIANSDPDHAVWYEYQLDDNDGVTSGKIFFDATNKVPEEKGLPDGLKVNQSGILFATGPGGVYVFNQEGLALGIIKTGEATANCALNTDESVLYMTADGYIMSIGLKK